MTHNHYNLFASLLSYPDKEMHAKVESMQEFLNQNYPNAAKIMIDFTEFARTIPHWKWEEIYTRSFDVQALTTLDMGYVLFGDDYKRGELLVNLNKEHKKAENDCGTELADHLPNLLRLIIKLNDDDFRRDLIFLIIIPALKKIIGEFENEKIHKKNEIYEKHHRTLINQEENHGRIYQRLLLALLEVFKTDFTDDQSCADEDHNFSKEITNELEIQS